MKSSASYKKLTELSFSDLYIDEEENNFSHIRTAAGRMYAKIHRRSTRIPSSLRVNDHEISKKGNRFLQSKLILPQQKQHKLT